MTASTGALRLCAFSSGDREYVIDVMRIRTIIRPVSVTPVAHAPRYIEGVIELRGSVIPLMDLRRRLGGPATELGPKARMLIVRVEGREVALLVDRVWEVMRADAAAITEVPPLLAVVSGGPRLFLGVCDGGRPGQPRLRLLLNVKALLDAELAPKPLSEPGAGA
jgi:purine-binding chemotaxis protein CheW